MRTLDELLAIAHDVREDVANAALGKDEVPERLIVVSERTASVLHAEGFDTYEGGVITFINDSGTPFAEQPGHLIQQGAELKPQTVLLAGSALVGRRGCGFRRVLAVQMFAARPKIRTAWASEVADESGPIRSVGPWCEIKAGPPIWAEEILNRTGGD